MIKIGASKTVAKNPKVDSYRNNGAPSPFECVDRSASESAGTEQGGFNVCTWLNLVCLDAPIVAVSWQWLFARSFGIPLALGGTAALFLTAWLIYLADRFGDSLSLGHGACFSLRQRFCLQHRAAWLAAIALVALLDLVVIATQLSSRMLATGAMVGAVALSYLVSNQWRSSLWQTLPLKELTIGFLFACGVLVPLTGGLTSAVLPSGLLFACLCACNCISIAFWEEQLDAGQDRVSIATVLPKTEHLLLPILTAVSLTSVLACAFAGAGRVVYFCIALSAVSLGLIHAFRNKIEANTRTALADLVLFTSLVVLLASGWLH